MNIMTFIFIIFYIGNEYINNADNIRQLNNRWDVFKREFNKNIEKEINNLKK
jgi:phage-related holin